MEDSEVSRAAVLAGHGNVVAREPARLRRWVKVFLERVARTTGYRLVPNGNLGRTWGSTLDQLVRLGISPRTVIDVGVAYGTPDLYRAFPAARHLLIEPLQEWEPFLKRICDSFNAGYVLAAAGEKQGTMTIRLNDRLLSSSSPFIEADGSNLHDFARSVPVVTIDGLCRERNLEPPYLIKVDVQGAELDVLRGAVKTLMRTDVVVAEVSLLPLFINAPAFSDVIAWMKSAGFVVYDIGGGGGRPFDGALAQVDLTFVKEHGPLRQHHGYR